MTKKRGQKYDDKKQSQRFVETARHLESEESGKLFEKAVASIRTKKRVLAQKPSGE